MTTITFRAAAAKYRDLIMLVGYAGATDELEPPTQVAIFDESLPAGGQWEVADHATVYSDVGVFKDASMDRPAFVCLSEEGNVWIHVGGEGIEECISDAGVFRQGSGKLGYLERIVQLGSELFACGFRGQVYRRKGPGNWEHFDNGVLERGKKKSNLLLGGLAVDVQGTFYAIDSLGGRLFYGQGGQWAELDNPSKQPLYDIVAGQDGSVWICGKRGTLLSGNAENGFAKVDISGTKDGFDSIVLHNGLIWLATPTALWTYDGDELSLLNTGLLPPLRSAMRLQSVEGVLWSFGPNDIARLGPKGWMRIPCPFVDPM